MASFQAKTVWKSTKKSENKNCLSVPFLPNGKYKIPKIEKKKFHCGFNSSPNRMEKVEKERK